MNPLNLEVYAPQITYMYRTPFNFHNQLKIAQNYEFQMKNLAQHHSVNKSLNIAASYQNKALYEQMVAKEREEIATLQNTILNKVYSYVQEPHKCEEYNEHIKRLDQIALNQEKIKLILDDRYQQNQVQSPILSVQSEQTKKVEMTQDALYRRLAIQRYKNKKRNNVQTITYQCRKTVADNRLRIKGRFISKQTQQQLETLVKKQTINEIFNDKKNLDVEKIQNKFNLFESHKVNVRKVTKENIIEQISKKVNEQQKILKKITKRTQVFKIICQ